MKKADLILIFAVGAVCAALLLGRVVLRKGGASLIVMVDGERYGVYSLDQNQKISIGDTNELTILDGEAYMSKADCPDQLCMEQGHISAEGEMIVCLPNRVTIEVSGVPDEPEKDGVDAVAG